jgi:serine kinase of HPr protein (carbohydrate metabolism regulator)
VNIHATAVALGPFGVLIEGPSASGKTSLALAAVAHLQAQGRFAALIADDQCIMETANGKLVANCPPMLTGLIEMRGLGVVRCFNLASIVVDFVVRLTEHNILERMPDRKTTGIADIQLPVFELPTRQIPVSLPLLMQILEQRRF